MDSKRSIAYRLYMAQIALYVTFPESSSIFLSGLHFALVILIISVRYL